MAAVGLSVYCSAHAAGGQAWDAEVDKPRGDSREAKAKPQGTEKGLLTLSGDQSATTAQLEVDEGATTNVFTLPNPYRVVIELTGTKIKSPGKAGEAAHGLVERYHAGRPEGGKSRIVIETLGPVKATPFPPVPGKNGRKILEVILTPMSVQEFGQGSEQQRAAALPSPAPGATPDFGGGLQALSAPPARPVIVIDPGHGGIDPGAVTADNLYEKAVVMAVAEQLRKALDDSGRYQVQMTRTTDVFVSLDQRVQFSRKASANLFISLHADSLEETSGAHSVSGATVYTLSEKASDERSRIMAEKENASDLLGGITKDTSEDNEVKDILIDLIRRETASFSAEFASVLRGQLRKSVQMSRDPLRSAAFKVLKQPHAPSVLIELGYMSNPNDAKQLNSPAWQKKVATAIAGAVDAYFANHLARAK